MFDLLTHTRRSPPIAPPFFPSPPPPPPPPPTPTPTPKKSMELQQWLAWRVWTTNVQAENIIIQKKWRKQIEDESYERSNDRSFSFWAWHLNAPLSNKDKNNWMTGDDVIHLEGLLSRIAYFSLSLHCAREPDNENVGVQFWFRWWCVVFLTLSNFKNYLYDLLTCVARTAPLPLAQQPQLAWLVKDYITLADGPAPSRGNAAVQSGQATFTCPILGRLLGVSSQWAGVPFLPLAGQWILILFQNKGSKTILCYIK